MPADRGECHACRQRATHDIEETVAFLGFETVGNAEVKTPRSRPVPDHGAILLGN